VITALVGPLLRAAAALPGAAPGTLTRTSTGEAVAFWVLAPVAVLCAVGLVLARNAVHAALLLVVVLFSLAICYAMEQAPFLAAVEIIVYAGAIMILFLFVLMIVGVDSSDSLVETLRGQRVAAVALTVGLVLLLVLSIGHAVTGTTPVGLDAANAAHGGNVPGIARLLFTSYVFPFEIISALLIVAAMGAMVLGHRERPERRQTQRELMQRRVRGEHPTPRPGPGVYALGDAADRPALLPDGAWAQGSVEPELVMVSPATPDRRGGGPDGERGDDGTDGTAR